MDKTHQSKYDEATASSAGIESSIQGDFIHTSYPPPEHGLQHRIQSQPGFLNSEFHHSNQQHGFVLQPHQPITRYPNDDTLHANVNYSYCERLVRSRHQLGSILGGLILMSVSGLHIGWGIWRLIFHGFWVTNMSEGLLTFTVMAWSLGAFVGGFIGSVLMTIWGKKVIYYIGGTAMLIGNLIITIVDDQSAVVIVIRILNGLGHGIVFISLVTQAGENADKNMRGTIVSTINFALYLGIFLSVVITGTIPLNFFGFPDVLSADRIIGIIGISFAIVSMAVTFGLSIETVPHNLTKNKHIEAMFSLQRLRGTGETPQLIREMEEFNLMVMQDKQDSRYIFNNGNGIPLMQTILIRLMVALTNNLLLNIVLITFNVAFVSILQFRLTSLILVSPRLLASAVQIFFADVVRRKTQIRESFVLAGLTLIVLGIFLNVLSQTNRSLPYVLAALSLVFQLACGSGIDQMQDVYLSEAFSTAKKPWSIAFVTAVEHLFHIIMIGLASIDGVFATLTRLNVMIFVTAGLIIVLGLILEFTLPETKGTTLKTAKDLMLKFRKRN